MVEVHRTFIGCTPIQSRMAILKMNKIVSLVERRIRYVSP